MKRAAVIATLLFATSLHAADFDSKAAERFANLALACVHKEYPNKISHNLNSDGDVAPPRKLTPAFYGCYDWALVSARALVAGTAGPSFPECFLRAVCTGSSAAKPHY